MAQLTTCTSPTISIITPVYNPGDYFQACLDSLEAQTIFPQLEVILIDDGSTDGSGELCDLFAQTHANAKVFHQPNKGQAAARNRGVDAASGAYLLFVDSDDAITSDACERLLAAATEEADMVWGDYTSKSLFKGPVAELAAQGPLPLWRYLRCALSSGLYFITPCVQLVRTSFLRDNHITFDEGRIFEDQLWTMCLLLHEATILRIDLPFYIYNIGDHRSSTTVVTAKRLMDAIDVVYAMIAEIDAANPPKEIREVAEAYVANSIAIMARTYIRHAPKRIQEFVRMRIDDTYAHYAAQTQLLPKDSRLIGSAFVNDPELFEEELARIHEARQKTNDTKSNENQSNPCAKE